MCGSLGSLVHSLARPLLHSFHSRIPGTSCEGVSLCKDGEQTRRQDTNLCNSNTPHYTAEVLRSHYVPNNLSRNSGPLFKEITPSLMGRLHTRGNYSVPRGKQIEGGVVALKRGGRTKDSFSKEGWAMADQRWPQGPPWGSSG